MLYEDDIVDAVCEHLKRQKCIIKQRLRSTERGDDIIAVHPSGWHLYIEAKGEGSAREGSARHGNTFNSGQVLDVVSKAFYRAASMLQENRAGMQRRAGLAFPDTPEFRRRVSAIDKSIDRLGLFVFWVRADGTVEEMRDRSSLADK